MPRSHLLAALLTGATFSAVILPAVSATAQETAAFTLSIPAQPLPQALSQLAGRAGVQFFYSGGAAYGLASNAVEGDFTLDQALAQMLAGTGARAERVGANGFTISVADEAPAPVSGALGGDLVLGPVEVVAGAGGHDLVYSSAGSVAYAGAEDIQRRLGNSTSDIFRGLPGVLSGDARASGAVDVNIRGMQGQGRVPVSVDGATQETTVYHGYNGSTARSYLDPDFIGGMTIEKGARVGADSTGANGGMVRVSTIAADDLLDPGQIIAFRLRGGVTTNATRAPEVGTLGALQAGDGNGLIFAEGGMDRPGLLEPSGGSGSLIAAVRLPFADVVLGYARRAQGNYFSGEEGGDGARGELLPNQYGDLGWTNVGLTNYRAGEEVLNTATDSTSWLAKVDFDLGAEQELNFAFTRYDSAFGHQLSTQLWGPGYQGKDSTLDMDTYTLRYRWNPADNPLIDFRLEGFQTQADNRLNTSYYVAWAGFLVDQPVWTGADRRGLTASNTSEFSGGWGNLALTYGLGWQEETVGLPDGVSQEEYTAAGGAAPARVGERAEWNAFLSSSYKPQDWLTFDAGLRWQRSETLDQGVMDPFASPLPDHESSHEGWSATAGVMAELRPGLDVYARAGSVIRTPSVFESLQTFSFFMPVGENQIVPERANTIEIGANYRTEGVLREDDRLQLHAAIFANHVQDYITRGLMPNGLLSNGNVRYQLSRVNLDHAEMRGFEISAGYDNDDWFGNLSWNRYTDSDFCLPAEADQTYGRCGSGGTYNSFALQMVPPKDMVTLELGAHFFDQALTLGGRYTYVGERLAEGMGNGLDPVYTGNRINASGWKPYGVLDLNASYRINDSARFDVAVDNVLDLHYMDALDITRLPAPGRTLRALMTVDF